MSNMDNRRRTQCCSLVDVMAALASPPGTKCGAPPAQRWHRCAANSPSYTPKFADDAHQRDVESSGAASQARSLSCRSGVPRFARWDSGRRMCRERSLLGGTFFAQVKSIARHRHPRGGQASLVGPCSSPRGRFSSTRTLAVPRPLWDLCSPSSVNNALSNIL
jgi:hypothetical protein